MYNFSSNYDVSVYWYRDWKEVFWGAYLLSMWSNTSPRYSPPKHWFFISCLQQITKAYIKSVFKWKTLKCTFGKKETQNVNRNKIQRDNKFWQWTSFNDYMWAWTNVCRCTSSSSILHSDTSPSSNLYHFGWLSSPLKSKTMTHLSSIMYC